jgi:hypothetical protein
MLGKRIIRAMAIAMAMATVGVAASAGPASATPIGPLTNGTISGFGNSWGPGAMGPGTLEWRPLAGGLTHPRIRGRLFINSVGLGARMKMVQWDSPLHNFVVATTSTPIGIGIAGLAILPVDLVGVVSASDHLHLQLIDDSAGAPAVITETWCTVGAGPC